MQVMHKEYINPAQMTTHELTLMAVFHLKTVMFLSPSFYVYAYFWISQATLTALNDVSVPMIPCYLASTALLLVCVAPTSRTMYFILSS